MSLRKVCIVTPIHNGRNETVRFLESVENLDYSNVEMIIIDAGSTDGSAQLIRERFPGTIVLAGGGDFWWSAATNLGVDEALNRGASYVYTVNNDVVLDKDAIAASVERAKTEPRAILSSTVFYLDDPDRIWFAGASLDDRTGDMLHDTSPILEAPVRESRMLTGMGMLIPSAAFGEVGRFDQHAFPHYLADCDFSLRAGRAGFKLLVARDSKIYNDVASAWSAREVEKGKVRFLLEMLLSQRSAYWVIGRYRFYRRHWGRGYRGALLRSYKRWFRIYAAPILKRRLLSIARMGRAS